MPLVNWERKFFTTTFLAIAVLGAALSGCSGSGPGKDDVEVTLYNGGQGVPLYTADDASRLTGAPKDFKQFMAYEVRKAIKADDPSCSEPAVYSVTAIASTGHASGEFSHCGTEKIFWARKSGQWIAIWHGTGVPPCSDLKRNKVPNGLAGNKCKAEGSTHVYTG